MYVLSWRTVSTLIRVLFWCLFSSLLRKSGNKHQINTRVSVEIVRHSSAYIILYKFTHSSKGEVRSDPYEWMEAAYAIRLISVRFQYSCNQTCVK